MVTVAAVVTDESAMSALFARFGADLPALGGVYLAAYGGFPVSVVSKSSAPTLAVGTRIARSKAASPRNTRGMPALKKAVGVPPSLQKHRAPPIVQQFHPIRR